MILVISQTFRWAVPLVVTALVGIAPMPVAVAAPVIQPGASITMGGSFCTLNWIYDGTEDLAGKVYGGTAAHCVDEVGQTVSLATGSLGDPVLEIGAVAYIDNNLDYAFIEIDPANHGLVDPALKGHPQIPTGVSTMATSQHGDLMQFSGHGVGSHLTETTQEERVGILNYNNGTEHNVTGPVTQGDSGGPVANLTDDGKAFGIVNTVGGGVNTGAMTIVQAGEGGLSLEGLHTDAAEAGFTVELRTVGGGVQETSVDEVSATVAGDGSVSISGRASFVDIPGRVGEDPAGDGTVSQGVLPLGDDLTSATIARPDPFSDTLTFSLGVANQPLLLDGVAEAVHYRWDIVVDQGGSFTLQAIRTGVSGQSVDPIFQVWRDSTLVAEVDGGMGDGAVVWDVPMTVINTEPGSTIRQGDDVMSVVGAYAAGVGSVRAGDTGDSITVDDYTTPGPSVRFGIAPAGTPHDQIPLTTDGSVKPDGTFTGSLPAPATPGDYTVVAQACYGPANCGLAATDITV